VCLPVFLVLVIRTGGQGNEAISWAALLRNTADGPFKVVLGVLILAAVIQEAQHLEAISFGNEFVGLSNPAFHALNQRPDGVRWNRVGSPDLSPCRGGLSGRDRFHTFRKDQIVKRRNNTSWLPVLCKS